MTPYDESQYEKTSVGGILKCYTLGNSCSCTKYCICLFMNIASLCFKLQNNYKSVTFSRLHAHTHTAYAMHFY